MNADQITFYVHHRRQISEWAALKERVDGFVRDAVAQGASESVVKILAAESGDAEVDFYVRNRTFISEWDALQTSAGAALHEALLNAAATAECNAHEEKRGWTSAHLSTPEFVGLRAERSIWFELVWTRQDLLSTRRGYPFPRIAVDLDPTRWKGEDRAALIAATRSAAHELGMKRRGATWWAHWGVLDEISESEDLDRYAERCFRRLREAAERMHPLLLDAMETQ